MNELQEALIEETDRMKIVCKKQAESMYSKQKASIMIGDKPYQFVMFSPEIIHSHGMNMYMNYMNRVEHMVILQMLSEGTSKFDEGEYTEKLIIALRQMMSQLCQIFDMVWTDKNVLVDIKTGRPLFGANKNGLSG